MTANFTLDDFSTMALTELHTVLARVTHEIGQRAGAVPGRSLNRTDAFAATDIISPAQAGGVVKLSSTAITRMAQEGVPWARQVGGPGGKWQISRILFMEAFHHADGVRTPAA